MSRLIKAEWHRIIHTGLLKWFFVICLLPTILAMLSSFGWYNKNLTENMIMCSNTWVIFIPIFMAAAIGVSIAMSYQSRLMLYEIMDGCNAHITLLSRLVLYVTFFTTGLGICTLGYLGSLAVINGVGSMDCLMGRVFLFLITLIHICAIAVLLSLLIKKFISVVCIILRFCLVEEVAVLCFSVPDDVNIGISADVLRNVSEWFVSGQLATILGGEITTHFVWASIFSLVIEGALLYVLNVVFLKRKIFA